MPIVLFLLFCVYLCAVKHLNRLVMKYQPKYYKVSPLSLIVRLESVADKLGNVYYAVTTSNGSSDNEHYLFKHLSSAVDFINSNFA